MTTTRELLSAPYVQKLQPLTYKKWDPGHYEKAGPWPGDVAGKSLKGGLSRQEASCLCAWV